MSAGDSGKTAGGFVRLSCRYSNGLVKTTVARAVAQQGPEFRVLSSEQFEPGLVLTAWASFLPAGQACRVKAVHCGPQAGSFLLDLELLPAGRLSPVPPPAAAQKPPVSFTVYAGELAARLDAAGRAPYYRAAFSHAGPRERQGFLKSTAAAVFLLLAQKGWLDSSELLPKLRSR